MIKILLVLTLAMPACTAQQVRDTAVFCEGVSTALKAMYGCPR